MEIRQDGRIVSVAEIVPVGLNRDGRRDVLGMDVGPSEAYKAAVASRPPTAASRSAAGTFDALICSLL